MRSAASPQVREAYALLMKLRNEKKELEKSIPTTMVMAEKDKPTDTFILGRGQVNNKLERVTPGVPAFLPQLPKNAPANRLVSTQLHKNDAFIPFIPATFRRPPWGCIMQVFRSFVNSTFKISSWRPILTPRQNSPIIGRSHDKTESHSLPMGL